MSSPQNSCSMLSLLRGLGAQHCLIQVPGSREMRSWGSNLLKLESQPNNFQGKTSMAAKYTAVPMVWPPEGRSLFLKSLPSRVSWSVSPCWSNPEQDTFPQGWPPH